MCARHVEWLANEECCLTSSEVIIVFELIQRYILENMTNTEALGSKFLNMLSTQQSVELFEACRCNSTGKFVVLYIIEEVIVLFAYEMYHK